MSILQGRAEDKLDIIEEKVQTPQGDVVRRQYRRGRFLGKGGFATCFEVIALDTYQHYASKVVSKETMKKEHTKQKLLSEIKIHRSLHHPGVVNFEHFFEDEENVYILLEMCSTDTMNEILRRRKRFAELEVQSHVLQLIEALKYLHAHQVIHRDLKLTNLFVSDKMEIKLGDFGLAAKLEYQGEKRRTICGTPNYIAPEILDSHIGHSFEVDIWSLGVIMYTMLVGRPPFETPDVQTTYDRIRTCNYTFPEKVALSTPCKELITRILVLDPGKRPTLDEILESPFLNRGYTVPRLLPPSVVTCPLSKSYVDKIIGTEEVEEAPVRLSIEEQPSVSVLCEEVKEPSLPVTEPPIISELDLPQYLEHTASDHCEPTVWVLKWVDFSSKYGIGYLLNNGCTGVCFNDFTKMVLEQDELTFTYVTREKGHKLDSEVTYPLEEENYPAHLIKKVKLLKHFRSFLTKDEHASFTSSLFRGVTYPVFVKKWIKTRYAILFRFSTKVIQVIFRDRSEVLLSSDTSLLIYINREGERRSYQLAEAQAESGEELSKRVKYTLEMLRCLLQKRKQTGVQIELN